MSETYDTSDVLPGDTLAGFDEGTNLIVVGPSMSGKRVLALELLAAGYRAGDGILCITTESAETVYADLEGIVDSLDRDRVGIVDTSGTDGTDVLDATVESIASPGDLTGISVGMAKLSEHFASQGVSNIRHGLISVSTLLQYLDADTVFKFLHVCTKRVEATDGLGVYTLDDDSHEPQVVNMVTGQFDGVLELRLAEEGSREVRIRGFGRGPTQWTTLDERR